MIEINLQKTVPPETALIVLTNATANVPFTRAQHGEITEALNVLTKLVSDHQSMKDTAKPCAESSNS